MSKNVRSGFGTILLRFLFPTILVTASYGLGTLTEARTMREQSIQLGTSGYNPKTSEWGLYSVQEICQESMSSLYAEDEALMRAAEEDQAKAVQAMSPPPKLPAGIFLKAQRKK